jgi:hypothetical protein
MYASKVYLMFLILPNLEHHSTLVSFLAGCGLCAMEHPFFDILSPGLMGATDFMLQESSGRKGIRMREVR